MQSMKYIQSLIANQKFTSKAVVPTLLHQNSFCMMNSLKNHLINQLIEISEMDWHSAILYAIFILLELQVICINMIGWYLIEIKYTYKYMNCLSKFMTPHVNSVGIYAVRVMISNTVYMHSCLPMWALKKKKEGIIFWIGKWYEYYKILYLL